ncbi:MAG: hypothetical protein HGN29_16665, partial [Asgard group archaeon]|nr:hypothetical protein [Asgard group archaeon]
DHEEVADLLFEKILEVFNNKGINNIRAVASEVWGNTLDFVKKWNFKEKEPSFYSYGLELKDAQDFEVDDSFEIVDFDYEKDLDQMIKIFLDEYGYTEELARSNFDLIKNSEGVYAHLLVKENDVIKGRALAYVTDNPKIATNAYIYGESKFQRALQKEIFKKSKEREVEKMQMFFNPQSEDRIQTYEEFGFKLECKAILFEKDI